MWHRQDPEGLSREDLLHLYQLVENREKAFRDDLFRFTNFYSAVCYAILAGTISGLITFHTKGAILMALLLGPILTFSVCVLAIRATGDIYKRIIEEVAVKAKLENALGLDCCLAVKEFQGTHTIWKEDTSLIPTRHAKRRLREEASEAFVKKSAVGGVYKENRFYFRMIGFFSLVLAAAVVYIANF